MYALISPTHKFENKEYTNISKIVIEGYYQYNDSDEKILLENVLSGGKRKPLSKAIHDNVVQDVMSGTSYDADRAKKKEKDTDGFDLNTITKFRKLFAYTPPSSNIPILNTDIKEIFYLKSLFNKVVKTFSDEDKKCF